MSTETKKVATPKKAVAPKVEKKENVAKEVATKVTDAAKSAVTTVEETATKATTSVADAAKSGLDTLKDTITDAETAISDARISGNTRAKKILTAIFDDKANETVTDLVGYIGEATAVCSTVMCSPMTVPANKVNTLYKKLTA